MLSPLSIKNTQRRLARLVFSPAGVHVGGAPISRCPGAGGTVLAFPGSKAAPGFGTWGAGRASESCGTLPGPAPRQRLGKPTERLDSIRPLVPFPPVAVGYYSQAAPAAPGRDEAAPHYRARLDWERRCPRANGAHLQADGPAFEMGLGLFAPQSYPAAVGSPSNPSGFPEWGAPIPTAPRRGEPRTPVHRAGLRGQGEGEGEQARWASSSSRADPTPTPPHDGLALPRVPDFQGAGPRPSLSKAGTAQPRSPRDARVRGSLGERGPPAAKAAGELRCSPAAVPLAAGPVRSLVGVSKGRRSAPKRQLLTCVPKRPQPLATVVPRRGFKDGLRQSCPRCQRV